jgi:NAD(P)-dependent dehydrogenase (short-subunit alcohol dehydrogenase family)
MSIIRFDGRVAIVTGAGGGLGRQYALELARRGAKVLVNDLGAAVNGSGSSSDSADKVVAEIEMIGGEAMSNGANVIDDDGAQSMVRQAMERWGRVDILIANAGFLRDKSFAKMEVADFFAVLDVHVMGTVKPIKAAWQVMKAQEYGRIVVTTSSSGLYGNFGQSNYGAAKLAVVGLMNTLKLEGKKDNIHINAISPMAATRMTAGLLASSAIAKFDPKLVAPGVICLVAEDAPTGVVLIAGAGVFAIARMYQTAGVCLAPNGATAEAVRAAWSTIADPGDQSAYFNGDEQGQEVMHRIRAT